MSNARMNESKIWSSYNELLLSADIDRIRKLLVRYDLFQLAKNIPGDLVECGVFKGTGFIYWLKLLAIYDPGSIKKVVGFDTFSEFANSYKPYEQKSVDAFVTEAEFSGTSKEAIMQRAEDLGLTRRAELVVGDLLTTAGDYVIRNPGFRISLLNLDVDTYEGTKVSLEKFYPVVSRGGVIVLDEYSARGWGESDAVDEFFREKAIEIKTVPFSSRPTAYLIKP
ncbi:MAG: class I SAM-dependent methyltransferase [Deltaproteobacteria bacterium]|nr:class I SAM-dependent methyltransferase [Deltaproteobacteria bacterium]